MLPVYNFCFIRFFIGICATNEYEEGYRKKANENGA